jgi:hypothetical protein
MPAEEIRSYLKGLKVAIRQMEDWTCHAKQLVDELDDDIMDYEENILKDSMRKMNRTATPDLGLPRRARSHCQANDAWLNTFAQELNQINKKILKKV